MIKEIVPWLRKFIVYVIAALILQCLLANLPWFFSKKIVLQQPMEKISRIDLMYGLQTRKRSLCTLEGAEIDDFLDSLMKLRSIKHFVPQGEDGDWYVRIVYFDGSVEILGNISFRYITADSVEHNGWYHLDEEDLYKLFSEYVDSSKLPSLSPGHN